MKLAGLASGSSGNAWAFWTDAGAILIDCGLSYKKLRERFEEIGLSPYDVSAVLLTHSHGDHHQAIRKFIKMHGPVVYCTEGTFQGTPYLSERPELVSILELRSDIEAGQFRVKAFPVYHDAEGAVTFSVTDGQHKVTAIFETGRITAELVNEARDADVILIEANHDPDLVADSINKGREYWHRYGDTPLSHQPLDVQERYRGMIPEKVGLSILGRHLANKEAAIFLAEKPLERCKLAVLAHLSQDRNRPDLALATVRTALHEAGREHIEVWAACQDVATPVIDLSAMTAPAAVAAGADSEEW